MRKRIWGLGVTATALTVSALFAGQLAAGAAAGAAAKKAPAEVRVNQVGYAPGASKVAFVMLPAKVASVSFTVSGSHGPVLRGTSRHFVGSWNANYKAVYELDFSRLHQPGTFRVSASAGGQTGSSPWFRIARSCRAVQPAGKQRGAVLQLRARRPGCGQLGTEPQGRQPDRRARDRVRVA